MATNTQTGTADGNGNAILTFRPSLSAGWAITNVAITARTSITPNPTAVAVLNTDQITNSITGQNDTATASTPQGFIAPGGSTFTIQWTGLNPGDAVKATVSFAFLNGAGSPGGSLRFGSTSGLIVAQIVLPVMVEGVYPATLAAQAELNTVSGGSPVVVIPAPSGGIGGLGGIGASGGPSIVLRTLHLSGCPVPTLSSSTLYRLAVTGKLQGARTSIADVWPGQVSDQEWWDGLVLDPGSDLEAVLQFNAIANGFATVEVTYTLG